MTTRAMTPAEVLSAMDRNGDGVITTGGGDSEIHWWLTRSGLRPGSRIKLVEKNQYRDTTAGDIADAVSSFPSVSVSETTGESGIDVEMAGYGLANWVLHPWPDSYKGDPNWNPQDGDLGGIVNVW